MGSLEVFKSSGKFCDGLVFQGEDEAMFMDYRKQMKVIFNNLAQLVSFLITSFF